MAAARGIDIWNKRKPFLSPCSKLVPCDKPEGKTRMSARLDKLKKKLKREKTKEQKQTKLVDIHLWFWRGKRCQVVNE